jgi:acyl-CoA synthetase (NDP forming)
MSCSGGEASIMADGAVGRSVRYRPLDAGERARVAATLSDLVTVANPLDYHTFVWAKEEAMTATFSAMIGCGFDLSMLVLDFPRSDRCSDADWDIAVRAIAHAAAATGGRTAVVASLPENMPEERAAELLAQNIAPLCGINEAHGAAEAAAFIGLRWKEPLPAPVLAPLAAPAPKRILFEAEAKQALADFGVPVPRSRVVCDPRQAAGAAHELGYPVVLKALGIAHKSESGAVRLNLKSAADVESAAQDLARVGTGLLVESMVTDAVAELLIGVTRDPQFGLLMTIGAGGVLVELLGEAASLLLPATEDEIRRAILSLKTAPLLQGFRGRPRGDLDAAIAAAAAAARYAEAHADVLEELEINPLLARPEGHGAVAVDALIRIGEAA